MKTKVLAIAISCLALFSAFAQETVFQSNFAANKTLKGWRDVWCQGGRLPVRADLYEVAEENEDVFFRTKKLNGKHIMFGISCPLKTAISVTDEIEEIRVETVLRKRKGNISYMASFALTSRMGPEGNHGQPFDKGADSGFQVTGNDYSYHFAGNFLEWRKNGAGVTLRPSKKPCNFLTALEKWVTWKLVYSNKDKELRFYRDADETKPFITQRNVDLNGTVLSSVWLNAYCNEYKDVKVTVIRGKTK